MPLEENQEQTVLAATLAGTKIDVQRDRDSDTSDVAVLPEGYSLESFEKSQRTPDRPKGTVELDDLVSFIEYCKRHMEGDYSVVYASRARSTVVAVLNEHSTANDANWRDWRAVYNAPVSPEWMIWKSKSDTKMKQYEFARFLEDNLPDITDPPGAQMLELARNFEAKKDVTFKSDIRQSDGSVQLRYEEQVQGSGVQGTMKVPEEFALGIPVYEGGTHYHVPARLRYRLHDGNLMLWYELIRPHKIIEDAFKQVLETIIKETQLPVFRGTP